MQTEKGGKLFHEKRRTQMMFAPQVYSQKGGSESEPSVSARANEQASRACLFAKKEEQRHERVLIFCKKNRSKRYKACSDVVPVAGLEPARCRHRWILSPLRLPIPSHRHKVLYYYIRFIHKCQAFSVKNLHQLV